MFSGWTQGGGLPPKTYESNFIHNSENSIRDIRAAIAVHDFTTAVLWSSPVATGGLVGLAPQTKLQAPSNWNTKHYKSVEFLSIFRMSLRPPYWKLYGNGFVVKCTLLLLRCWARNETLLRLTIRPVLAETVPVLRALSRSVNQNVPVRHLLSQDSPTQWRSEAKCRPWPAKKVPPFPHLKFAYSNLKCIKINVNPVNTSWALLMSRNQLDKIGEIGLKPALVEKRWLAAFIMISGVTDGVQGCAPPPWQAKCKKWTPLEILWTVEYEKCFYKFWKSVGLDIL